MFITIDGPDGSGKTTVARLVVELFRLAGQKAVFTTEPTDGPTGQKIRTILRQGGTDAALLTDLFIADRAEHVQNFIIPQQQAGVIVVSDRYKYSTVCYQHLQTGRPLTELIDLNASFPAPDLAVILDVADVSVLLQRIGQRKAARDIFETREFLQKNLELYRLLPRYYVAENIHYVDAGQTPEAVAREIFRLAGSAERKTI